MSIINSVPMPLKSACTLGKVNVDEAFFSGVEGRHGLVFLVELGGLLVHLFVAHDLQKRVILGQLANHYDRIQGEFVCQFHLHRPICFSRSPIKYVCSSSYSV